MPSTYSTSSNTFRPLGGYERIGLCRDSCVPVGVLDVMAAWHRLATALQKGGIVYPGIYFPLPNQLLREQTNINDGKTLRALPNVKTQAGATYKSLDGAVVTHNTPVCRHFMHWLKSDVLPQRAFPALQNGTDTDEVNRIKAIMYYVLWHENQQLARQLGEPPKILLQRPEISYDEIKERGTDFAHVKLARERGKIALHHALVTGIRGSSLWPWNDAHFKDEDGKVSAVLSDFHFNLADLSMVSMFMNGITQNPGDVSNPRNHLVMFVSRDSDFMQEISEFAYGHRVVKSTVDGSEHRRIINEYNELSRQIEDVQNQLRRNAKNGQQKSDDSRQAIARIVQLRHDRKQLRDQLEAPLKGNGNPVKSHVVPLLDDEYERYAARGLVLAKPPPYAERPDILVLSPKRFVMAMKEHDKEVGKLIRSQKGSATNLPEIAKALSEFRAELFKLDTGMPADMTANTSPDSIFNLQEALRHYVEKENGLSNGNGGRGAH
ncbi:MAG: hypothetical protein AB7L92_00735 [Alphaproteobacteria bacterium]